MHRRRLMVVAGAAAIATLTVACTGEARNTSPSTADRTAADPTTTPAPATAPASTASPTSSSSVPVSTSPPDPTTTTSTTAPRAVLTFERTAEYPGTRIRLPFSDGSSAVALASVPRPDGLPSATLVRIDGNGTVVAAGPVEGVVERGPTRSTIEAAGRRFLLADWNDPQGFQVGCGLREIDPVTLTMGPLLTPTADAICWGEFAVSDIEPTVVWILGTGVVDRIDTATGVTTRFPIDGVDFERQVLQSIQVVGGNPYIGVGVYTDSTTGRLQTAPDGSPIPRLVVRVDAATGATASGVIGGSELRLTEGRLNVWTTEASQVIDPVTLAATDVDPSALRTRPGDAEEIWFTHSWDGDSHVLEAYQSDPATGTRLSEGSLDSGLGESTRFDGVWIGADLLVFAVHVVVDPATGSSGPATDLFVVRQP